ncbi:MAG: hypothetical protein RL398_3575 [Planctomycetota bacterium]
MSSPTEPSALRLLVADDEESMRHFVTKGLKRLGYEVTAVEDGEAAAKAWSAGAFDAAVLDLKMPVLDGIGALQRIRSAAPDAAVVMMTAHGTIANAVEAMQLGAADFLSKPFALDELQMRLQKALGARAQRRENAQLRSLVEGTAGGVGIVAESPAMADLVRRIDLLAQSEATVLLTGASGTGKGLVAKALHRTSARRDEPFVALNCAAMPDTLVESELFGHEAGAFTGAQRAKQGLLARANRGTVFLDEIGDMSLAAQAKIERFLQDKEFLPLGAGQAVRVDVRVIAATNRDLAALVASGAFRAELLYRLDVVHLHVPNLRDRREDIPVLLARNLERLTRPGTPPCRLTPEAIGALCVYDWPGNVRELENSVERMLALAGNRTELGVADLPAEVRSSAAGEASERNDYETARRNFDRAYFTSLLMQTGGSITEAARQAGLSRGHLHRRLKELGCDAQAAREAGRSDVDDREP